MQSEVGQKEKDKYCLLTHVYGIQKDGTNEPTCRAAVETDVDNRLVDGGRREWGELRELHGNIYITICKIDSQ